MGNCVEENRLGIFRVTKEFIENAPDEAKKIMAHMIIIGVEPNYFNNTFKYIAYSDLFEPKQKAEIKIPLYYLNTIDVNNIKADKVKW